MSKAKQCGDKGCMECENEALRAENADLKARLKAARARFWRGAIAEAHDALDLRVKNWRKPR